MKDGSRESAAGRWVSSFYGLSILGKMWPRRSSGPVTRGQGWGGGTAFFLVVAAICLACSRNIWSGITLVDPNLVGIILGFI